MRIAVTGASGMLARAVLQCGADAGHEMIPLDRAALDVTDRHAARTVITRTSPDVVIHCAAYTRVDDAESESEEAHRINAYGAQCVADAASHTGALFTYPSTDYVFDGTATRPYSPADATAPLNEYGKSKLAGERAAQTAARHHVIRTSWLYGEGGRNFVSTMLQRGRSGTALKVVDDQRGAPTWTRDLARMIIALADVTAPNGIYHCTNAGETTWYDFARAIFEITSIDADLTPVRSASLNVKARRPHYSVLDCSATWALIGSAAEWRDALVAAIPTLE